MKRKITLLSFCFIATLGVNAQNKKNYSEAQAKLGMAEEITSSAAISKNTRKASSLAPFLTVDFGSGIPASWGQDGSDINNLSGLSLWEYRGTATTPNNTVGSRGAYKSGGAIPSATTANGFVIFDSDFLDNGGTAGAFGSGTNPAYTTSAPTGTKGHSGSLITNAIDISSHPTVQLTFSSYIRHFNAAYWVLASTDSTNWNDTLDVTAASGGLTVNASAAIKTINWNLSCAVSGQAKLWLKFVYDGITNVNNRSDDFRGYYYWQIDDIELTELGGNDMAVGNSYIIMKTNLDTYTQIPQQHLDSMLFQADVYNNGANPQTNVVHSVVVNDGTSDVYTYSSPSGFNYPICVLADTVMSSGSPLFFAQNKGTYTVVNSVSQSETDDNPSNSIGATLTFEVTDSTYARDNGNTATASSTGTNTYTGGDQDGFCMANLYEFSGLDTLSSISFQLVNSASNFATGAIIRGFALWESQMSAFNVPFPTDSDVPFYTDYYTVQAGDAGNWVTLPFTNFAGNSVTADASFADSSLVAGVYFFGSTLGGKRLAIFDDITTFQASTTSVIYLAASANRWYSNGNAFFIRLNMKRSGSTGVKENVANGLRVNQNQPNPAKASSVVNYELEKASNVSIQVTDITGKVVFSESYGVKASGRNSIELNTSNLDAGVYFYTLKADEASITKKMSVIK